ncbi:MAG: SIS domain-containing protein [Methylococcaceae bacterium]|nr:MAG: SIS domain-containing protein [Methylococcaceae bacterium]
MNQIPATDGFFSAYAERLGGALHAMDWSAVGLLAAALTECWRNDRQVFLCGNGGSAGNAVHLATDFLYGIGKERFPGMRAHALSANTAILTCLGNDLGYEHIFSRQLETMANPGDLLIAFSGSGNSANILAAIEAAKNRQMRTFAVLGYDGGKAKAMVDVPIHFAIDDMQMAEDLQLIVGHMLMQWLYAHPAVFCH